MSEEAKEITVKVQLLPNEPGNTQVQIKPNATVAELEKKFKDAINDFEDVPMGILKFNGKELDNKDKTLNELGIGDGSEIENENRVVLIKPLTGKTIYITCDENTTVREFLKKLKDKEPNWNYIRLIYEGNALPRSTLDQKLLGCQIGKKSIKYGTTLTLTIPVKAHRNSDKVFDLNNLEESKNSNYPLLRIIVGIADLLLLAAAVATFLLYFLTTLSLSVAVPIVLAALFVVFAVVFLGWHTILPKILPKGCLKKINSGADLGKENEYEIDEKENDKGNNPKEKEEYKGEKKEEEEYDSL